VVPVAVLIRSAIPWLVFAIYLLPSIVALLRKSAKTTAVVIINLLLAWTVIGWFVALVMAFASPRRPPA
jgi:hypothetical protein